ncbi:MAG: rod shape-determining protein RodA [Bacteroidota bacterium]|jgi:rod shape determining protein RodA|nr:rod shape-determining protein RodA [Bacteroidota bacterium]MEC8679298.1 rod shape-determining protein RodA [Bacteroidota bacterium]|tara:strand:- start:1260 stop:2522 length:1263 start_codon:yes stop_codon:yes gene_type:complete
MRKISNNFFSNDFIITGIYFTMLLIGFLSIYSSQNTDGYGFLSFQNESFKQLIWIFICLFVFFAISILEYRFIFDLAVPLYGLSLFLLVLVLFIGQEVNSHSSWFNLFGLKFQPSEFSKFSTALFLAKIFDSYSINLRNIKHVILTSLVFLLPSSIILLQGDTGTALVYFSFFLVFLREGLSLNFLIFSIAFVLIFVFGLLVDTYILYIIITVVFLVYVGLSIKDIRKVINSFILFVLSILIINGQGFVLNNILTPKQKQRVETLINPSSDPLGSGWNITQSKIAIGSGGVFGKGFLKGTQTGLNFVPIQSTDFIFSVIGEEFGYLGSMIFIILYVIFLYRILILSEAQKDRFARVFGYSVFSIFLFHFTINVSMTLGLFPVIGIPLSLISYGGSSLLSFSLLLFVFLKLNGVKSAILGR